MIEGLGLDEPEVLALSERAQLAHCRAYYYAATHRTGGALTVAVLAHLRINIATRGELVAAGIWEWAENGTAVIRGFTQDHTVRPDVDADDHGAANGVEEHRVLTPADRARRYRERKRNTSSRESVTERDGPRDESSRNGVTKSDDGRDAAVTARDAVSLELPSSPSGSDSALPPNPESSSVLASDLKDLTGSARVAKRGPKRKLETEFPDDFSPTKTELKLASDLGLTEYRERAQFRDTSLAKGWTARDWLAKYRTWLRKSAEFKATYGRAPGATEHAERPPTPAAQTYFELEPELPPEERLSASEIRALAGGIGRRVPA
jgi:hypothetical protein